MIRQITIQLSPAAAASETQVRRVVAEELGLAPARINGIRILKRSVDARPREPRIALTLEAAVDAYLSELPRFEPVLKDVSRSPEVIIVGAGPAGLFAALRLIALGLKPVIIERGKDVRSRRRDLAAMNKEGIVNPESNYCFGEGGAGTFSDGKLYTRSTKRGSVTGILNLFHHFGATGDILIDAHPHIGTNKLPGIITAIREQIIACGGFIHFQSKVTDLLISGDCIEGIRLSDGASLASRAVILATGHSARDIYQLLYDKKIPIQAKPFALGVRIEHPQTIIDRTQYHCTVRDPLLPPASYALVAQVEGRGVFSFCMCPGGIIAPAATAPGEVVVNGWSPSKRNNPFANSGTVVAVDEKDFARHGFTGPLAAMHYQQMVERAASAAGGGLLVAPAQRLVDFANNRPSSALPACSYLPGISSCRMDEVLPAEIAGTLRKGIAAFGKKMPGYYTNEALLVATESRTSSPVRIPRDPDTLQHTTIRGLFPCAEGAGYAGGIVSAAIDGEKCAEGAARLF